MKKFENPMVEIVYFDQKDVIATSPVVCTCVECTICPDGKNDCSLYDNL